MGNKERCIDMAKRLMVDSIWKSANLEGLGTTFPKTEAILENIPTDTTREEVLFVVNMKRAWEFLIANTGYNNCFMLIREFNRICMENFRQDAGQIRKGIVGIGGTTWTPEIPIDTEVYESIAEINIIKSPINKALKYFCYLARTQIFNDGNKRVAQLMANKVLIENGIGIFQIPVEVLEPFKSLLISYYESGDDSVIIDFMKNYCIHYLDKGFIKKSDNKEVKISKFNKVDNIPRFVLSSNQVKIFNSLLKNLRSLLYSYGIKGSVELKEDYGGSIILYSPLKGNIYIRYSNGRCIYSSNYDSSVLGEFVMRTIELLVENIPFPIKKLEFDVSKKDLYFGEFVNSKEEEGSINIRLL